jgi:hypothetical protein
MRTTPIIAALALLTPACSSHKDASCPASDYDPAVVAAQFSSTIDNRFLPFSPGTVFQHRSSEGNLVETEVTSQTRTLIGIECRVVHDVAKTPAGQLLEDTYDYYAQDRAGNVWYFGEDTKAYVGTKVSTEGSWLSGVDCAQPGIVMKASPQIGDSYRQEYLAGAAEDQAEVVSVNETVTVPYGTFTGCVMTKEHTALAPGDVENKYYCAGLGEVLAHDIGTIDAGKREELVSINGRTAP